MISNKDLRVFGYIWAVIFAFISYISDTIIADYTLSVAIFFVISATFFPKIYMKIYFYQLWVKFGNYIGIINSKIIIFILFFLIFTPIGIILRIFRKDLLNKKFDKNIKSYFIDRKDKPGSMVNQF